MSAQLLDLRSPALWPDELRRVLDELRPTFRAWELRLPALDIRAYDDAMRRLWTALSAYDLVGYHFTRLTTAEVERVRAGGLEPLSQAFARGRIELAVQEGVLSESTAQQLLARNLVDRTNRSGRTGFCFYPPADAYESAVRPLLSHWGGEAICNLHAEDAEVGAELRRIGHPSVVIANVPIASLRAPGSLDLAVVQRDLANAGEVIEMEHDLIEGQSHIPIEAARIVDVVMHPIDAFTRLTGCDRWHDPLR